MKRIKTHSPAALSAVLLCAGLILGSNVFAADTNPCAEDIAKFCPNVKPGGGAIMECLEAHENELSTACRFHEAKMHNRKGEMKERVQEYRLFRQDCGADISKFCRDIAPGDGGVVQCLDSHGKDLSAVCSERLKTMRATKE